MDQDAFNKILFFFYSNQKPQTLTKEHFKGINAYPIIHELLSTGLLCREVDSKQNDKFWMSFDGIAFMKGLPESYKNNPYQYYLMYRLSKYGSRSPTLSDLNVSPPLIPNTRTKRKIKWDIIGVISLCVTIILWLIDHYIFKNN